MKTSLASETGVHLIVDAAVAHLDLEGALVAPSVVPGVDAEPVVLTTFGTPTDGLDGVATKSRSGLVGVDSGLVGQEVLIDSEGRGDGTILVNVSLDLVDAAEAVAGGSGVLVVRVSEGS